MSLDFISVLFYLAICIRWNGKGFDDKDDIFVIFIDFVGTVFISCLKLVYSILNLCLDFLLVFNKLRFS